VSDLGYSGSRQVIPNSASAFIEFGYFETTDQSVFATSIFPSYTPNNTLGDNQIILRKAGVYVVGFDAYYLNTFAQFAYFNLQVGISNSAGVIIGPSEWFKATPPAFPAVAVYGATGAVVVHVSDANAAGGGANVLVETRQNSGGDQEIGQLRLGVTYVAGPGVAAQVY
jgi:hypothetical protein